MRVGGRQKYDKGPLSSGRIALSYGDFRVIWDNPGIPGGWKEGMKYGKDGGCKFEGGGRWMRYL